MAAQVLIHVVSASILRANLARPWNPMLPVWHVRTAWNLAATHETELTSVRIIMTGDSA